MQKIRNCGSEARIEAVLSYWFGTVGENGFPAQDRRDLWFGASPETDAEIAARFGDDVERAGRGELESWARTPRGRLALILLLDQFSRNIHRGTPEAFANDDRALALCLEGLRLGHDRTLRSCERVFFYLPLEHSEDPVHQSRCVGLLEELLRGSPQGTRPRLEEALAYARKHRDIVERFGRFPHRNPILGRASTPEEERFLRSQGETFGQPEGG